MIYAIVSGAGGQLGQAFIEAFSFAGGFSLYAFDKSQLDISDQDKINRLLDSLPQIQYWINCAAYTKVDDAEKNADEAMLFNATAPGYIAEACKARNIHLLHFSSDYVYHNDLRRPLLEHDPTEPKGMYAKTKLEGEKIIQSSGVAHTIIRTSWVYGPGGHNFVNTMLRLGKTKESLKIVSDQLGAPTFTIDIARACRDLVLLHQEKKSNEVQGIFNFTNQGSVTWDNFARQIFRQNHIPCEVISITSEEYGAPVIRPAYSVLNCEKIRLLLSFTIPSWEDALSRYLKSIAV